MLIHRLKLGNIDITYYNVVKYNNYQGKKDDEVTVSKQSAKRIYDLRTTNPIIYILQEGFLIIHIEYYQY